MSFGSSPTILYVVGARPNFMKIAPVMRAVTSDVPQVRQVLVHTGQHYSPEMSQIFLDELGLPAPEFNLEVGSGSHAVQTAEIMRAFEPVVHEVRPDWVMVPGDVNSTLACALVASKLGVAVAHLEAGLRSFDRAMPEEINRVVCDHLAELLLTPSPDADANLQAEGIPAARVVRVGNAMIDTLVRLRPLAEQRWHDSLAARTGGGGYVLVTLHRPANVDAPQRLQAILTALNAVATQERIAVVFPMHPRTQAVLREIENSAAAWPAVQIWPPLGYLDFLAAQSRARLVVTDSGGIQEETTFLQVPCLTFRQNTERPVTITEGTNRLIGNDPRELGAAIRQALHQAPAVGAVPALWDGRTGVRVAEALALRLMADAPV